MTPEQALRAIQHYELSVMGPTGSGVPEGSRWYACTSDRSRYGFGPTALAAIEAATNYKTKPAPTEALDFLE